MESAIAGKYASALLQAALAQKKAAEVAAEMQGLQRLMEKDPALRLKLEHPRLGASEKMGFLEKALSRKPSRMTENLLLLLFSKKREKWFGAVAERYERLYHENQGKAVARVVTALPLTPDQRRALAEKLGRESGWTVEIREEIRPALIGGILIYMGDQRLDGSLLGQLEKVNQALLAEN